MSSFQLNEVVAARDASRGFSSLLEQLRDRSARRFVILYRNRPHAVLVSVEEYNELVRRAEGKEAA